MSASLTVTISLTGFGHAAMTGTGVSGVPVATSRYLETIKSAWLELPVNQQATIFPSGATPTFEYPSIVFMPVITFPSEPKVLSGNPSGKNRSTAKL